MLVYASTLKPKPSTLGCGAGEALATAKPNLCSKLSDFWQYGRPEAGVGFKGLGLVPVGNKPI